MERLFTAREYARMVHADDERQRGNLERRLQRYAKGLPEEERQMVGQAYALLERQWEALLAQERKAGRPKKQAPET